MTIRERAHTAKKTVKKTLAHKKKYIKPFIKISWWFTFGSLLGFFFFTSFLYILYQQTHAGKVYEGVSISGVNFSGKTHAQVQEYFAQKNHNLHKISIMFTNPTMLATVSAKQIGFGYDENLLADQAMSVGRSGHHLSTLIFILQGYFSGINLPPAYHYSEPALQKIVATWKKQLEKQPVNALFTFNNNRVVAFQLSQDGKRIDIQALEHMLTMKLDAASKNPSVKAIAIAIPITTQKPAITTESVNNLGIKELIGQGTSLFYHSIESRIYNVNLAATRINGALIPPGQVFSFDKTVGDISSLTGYKQAYIIENGKTVLGDGGGVCQVSTTLFRAALNAGLPIVERHQHAYRVGYYEEDSPPGIDAAVYSPTVDLKFKNDTGHYILIQTIVDLDNLRLTFNLYGTNDGRVATINKPVVLSESPAPDPLYQDDPTLPKGEVKQIDFAAGGANVYFTRTVTKNGQTTLSDKFVSDYRPWQAVYLRGIQE